VSVYRDFFERKTSHFIYEDYLFGIFNSNLTFHEFVKRLSLIPHHLKDQHLRPQYLFVEYYQDKSVELKIIKLEDSDQIHQFASDHDLKISIMNKSPESYDYRTYYDAQTMDIAYRIYKNDVVRFHYESEYNDLRTFVNNKP
jgi:hypothetical protein